MPSTMQKGSEKLMTKTIKVAKKDVKKFEELISDFNKWMKENTPLEKE